MIREARPWAEVRQRVCRPQGVWSGKRGGCAARAGARQARIGDRRGDRGFAEPGERGSDIRSQRLTAS